MKTYNIKQNNDGTYMIYWGDAKLVKTFSVNGPIIPDDTVGIICEHKIKTLDKARALVAEMEQDDAIEIVFLSRAANHI